MRRITAVNRSGRLSVSTRLLRRLALASLIANVVIVVTGGAVRLTGSGLGCPTWPRCTEDSYVATAEMGIHGAIEFGNRMITWVVGAIAIAGLIAALRYRPRRRSLVLLSGAVLFGVALQAIVGGITVRTGLHPSVVGIHFILSMALLLCTYAFWRRVDEADGPVQALVPGPLRTLTWITVAVSAAVLFVGVAVTGSGPHSGDPQAPRNGLDPEMISQVHADVVFLLIGLSIALWYALRAVDAPPAAIRAAGILVVVELSQSLIGFVEYFTGLPAVLVGAHMLGSCLVWLATLAVLWATRKRQSPTGSSVHAAAPPAELIDTFRP
ncbi:MAG TPA: COX15/CtaA family protein [Micromonospora sp.]|nr:COX15/CtaA family protein [Micromonospora sp.]